MLKHKCRSYGNYSNRNYGVNSLTFCDHDRNQFWFSYDTLIAFFSPKTGLVVHTNDWSRTTGKHLNIIDGGVKKLRVADVTFLKLYQEAFGA